MHVRIGSGAALAATLALLAGCGGSSSSDQTATFKSSFLPVVNGMSDSSHTIGLALQQAPSQTNAQIGAAFHGLAGRWQSQLSRLQALKPPSKFTADFTTLTSAATHVESDLNTVVSAAAANDKNAGRQAFAGVVQDILAAKSASTSITDKLGSK